MYQNINKIYHAAIYVRLSKEDGDISSIVVQLSRQKSKVFIMN